MPFKTQGAVLVIMGAILSTLTSVSLHYDHSRMALPLEVIVNLIFFFVIIIEIVFLIVIHIVIVFLPIIAIVPIEGPALQRWAGTGDCDRRLEGKHFSLRNLVSKTNICLTFFLVGLFLFPGGFPLTDCSLCLVGIFPRSFSCQVLFCHVGES